MAEGDGSNAMSAQYNSVTETQSAKIYLDTGSRAINSYTEDKLHQFVFIGISDEPGRDFP